MEKAVSKEHLLRDVSKHPPLPLLFPPHWKVTLLSSKRRRAWQPGTCSLCSAWARPHGALSPRVIDGAFLSPQGRQQWVHRDGWAGAVQTVGAHSTPVFPGNLFPVSLVLLGHKTSSLRSGRDCPGKASPRDDFAHLQSSLSYWGALATTRAAIPGTRLGCLVLGPQW